MTKSIVSVCIRFHSVNIKDKEFYPFCDMTCCSGSTTLCLCWQAIASHTHSVPAASNQSSPSTPCRLPGLTRQHKYTLGEKSPHICQSHAKWWSSKECPYARVHLSRDHPGERPPVFRISMSGPLVRHGKYSSH